MSSLQRNFDCRHSTRRLRSPFPDVHNVAPLTAAFHSHPHLQQPASASLPLQVSPAPNPEHRSHTASHQAPWPVATMASCNEEATQSELVHAQGAQSSSSDDTRSLFPHIHLDHVWGLNIDPPESARSCVKPWHEREDTQRFTESGVDDQVRPALPQQCARVQGYEYASATGRLALRKLSACLYSALVWACSTRVRSPEFQEGQAYWLTSSATPLTPSPSPPSPVHHYRSIHLSSPHQVDPFECRPRGFCAQSECR